MANRYTQESQMRQTVKVCCAPARPNNSWSQTNWLHIIKQVKRLQERIAQAVLAGRWGKARALQHLLTRSYGGKMLAVKRVTENRGKRTPGIDRQLWISPTAKWEGMLSLRHHGYRALPLRRIYIPKSNSMVTSSSKEILVQQVLPAVKQFMAARGLELSNEKTKITHIAEGFDFLGQNVRKYNGKLLIKPAKKSVKALLDKVREITKRSISATQALYKLNPIIRGWAQYHRHVVAKASFDSIDHTIWQYLWKWAKRRHQSKGVHWIKQKYFHRERNQDWVFSARERCNAETRTTTLFNAASVPIVRHIKICQLANPFDPQWNNYFIQRNNTMNRSHCPVP